MTYGANLRAPLDDALVNRLADELIRQRFFTLPVADYYQAAAEALRSGERLCSQDDQDEGAVRDLITRLVKALDERRPWPEAAYQALPVDETLTFANMPLIGRIHILPRDVEGRLSRGFSKRAPDDGGGEFLVLRLRTGQQVVLRVASFREANIEVYSTSDPAATRAALRELTGLDAHPAESG